VIEFREGGLAKHSMGGHQDVTTAQRETALFVEPPRPGGLVYRGRTEAQVRGTSYLVARSGLRFPTLTGAQHAALVDTLQHLAAARHPIGESQPRSASRLLTFLRLTRRAVRAAGRAQPIQSPDHISLGRSMPRGGVVRALHAELLVAPDARSARTAGVRIGVGTRGMARPRSGGRSVLGTASFRAGEDVFPLAEIVPWVQGTATFPPPAIDRDGLCGLPAFPLPAIEEDRDAAQPWNRR